jgi:hypothetical protein
VLSQIGTPEDGTNASAPWPTGASPTRSLKQSDTYRGGDARDWLRTKCHQTARFIITGFQELGEGRLEAVHVAEEIGGRLLPAREVGFGFAGRVYGAGSISFGLANRRRGCCITRR